MADAMTREEADNGVWSGCTFGLCRKMIRKIAHSYFYYSR
jgi:ribosomal protein S14